MEEYKDTQYTKNMFIFSGAQEMNILYALLPSSHPTPSIYTPREKNAGFWPICISMSIPFSSSMKENKRLIEMISFIFSSEHYILLMISTWCYLI